MRRMKFSCSKPARTLHAFLGACHAAIHPPPLLVRASALSFSTLLAMIPLLAVALSVTSTLLKDQDEEKIKPVH